jgi:hypothetical protein
MALQSKTKFAYGWQIKPTFDEALDAVEKPLRIPLPDRRAKLMANSLYRNKIVANERLAMGYEPQMEPAQVAPQTNEQMLDEVHEGFMAHQVAHMEHQATKDTIPAAVLQVQPSPSADDVVWQEIQEAHQINFRNAQQVALRHRVDEQVRRQMHGERFHALFDAYSQGRRNPILQGEAPLGEQFKTHLEESPMVGHFYREVVPTAVPIQPPLVAGYTAHHEFTPFRELNYRDVTPGGKKLGIDFLKQGDSYESFRRIIGRPENLW